MEDFLIFSFSQKLNINWKYIKQLYFEHIIFIPFSSPLSNN